MTTTPTPLNAGEMRLELVHIPVTDVDRARDFYVQQCGWVLVTDHVQMEDMRIVQIVPPGSHCGILLGRNIPGITDMAPGSQKGIHLVVPDVTAARDRLVGNGVEMGEIQDLGGVLYSGFEDPDGNMWLLQQWPHGGTHDYS
ncbi:VOC family protein [Nocardioides islandensis]|jgi:catechol 2,3-dioxygenase-like lactoylglutathione lyase family enzyme|nr:VOC family protein [Nocardioides islandensis]